MMTMIEPGLSKTLRAAALLLCATALGSSAQAADPAAKGGNVLSVGGKPGPKGKLLTRDELRQCLRQQPEVKAQGEEATRAQAALDAEKAELARQEGELAERSKSLEGERATVNASDQAAVDAFNASTHEHADKIAEHQRRMDDYNARLPAFNAKADAYNTTQQRYNAACADRPYEQADYYAIQRGK